MTGSLRRLRKRHAPHGFPLIALLERLRTDPVAAADPAALGREHGLPASAVRAILTYFPALQDVEEGIRVCRGSSCSLAGGADIEESLGRRSSYGSVYCLGHCDHSPALLIDGERVVHGPSALAAALGVRKDPTTPTQKFRTSIRCDARVPFVTGRAKMPRCETLAGARAAGAYLALESALRADPNEVLHGLERSGLRRRHASELLEAAAWRRCADAPGPTRYVIARGDEGDPGAFVDRVLMERDPHGILEGLVLAGWAVGANEGILHVRSEYPAARRVLARAIEEARAAGILGDSVLGTDFAFDVALVRGMGGYVGGEETALLNALEGVRGEVRLRPPDPLEAGLFGRPTLVADVATLVVVANILARGPEAYAALGRPECPGTKVLSLNRGFARPGVVEVEHGVSLRRVVEELAGGARRGRRLAAVLLGGPMGNLLFPEDWDVRLCPAELERRGRRLGHGGLVAIPEGVDWRGLVASWLHFLKEESCGKCVPCSLGSDKAVSLFRRGERGAPLTELLRLIADTSLCGLGKRAPRPVLEALARLGPDLLASRLRDRSGELP